MDRRIVYTVDPPVKPVQEVQFWTCPTCLYEAIRGQACGLPCV